MLDTAVLSISARRLDIPAVFFKRQYCAPRVHSLQLEANAVVRWMESPDRARMKILLCGAVAARRELRLITCSATTKPSIIPMPRGLIRVTYCIVKDGSRIGLRYYVTKGTALCNDECSSSESNNPHAKSSRNGLFQVC